MPKLITGTYQNQIDLRNGANINANDKIEGELLFGKGRAYGLELMLKKVWQPEWLDWIHLGTFQNVKLMALTTITGMLPDRILHTTYRWLLYTI